jgi:hypothetical protein
MWLRLFALTLILIRQLHPMTLGTEVQLGTLFGAVITESSSVGKGPDIQEQDGSENISEVQ